MNQSTSLPRFSNKVALITGAASGMGRSAAKRLSSEGAHVIIVDRDVKGGEQVAATIREGGGQAVFMEADLTEDGSIENLVRQVTEQFDALHVLVHNAFINIQGKIEDSEWLDQWEPGVVIGLRAPAYLTQLLLPLMKQEGASIVNISSDGGFRGRPGMWLYDAMKAALVSLTKTMACEFVDYGIRVNAIAPGWIVTEIHAQNHPDPQARLKEMAASETDNNIMRRLGMPEEVAAGLAFLASDEASFITGTTLHIDGGRAGINTVPGSLWLREER
jgi:NAD(P)-dependent dehydrogenase (short-subunit alcohol dehydrogenase family)